MSPPTSKSPSKDLVPPDGGYGWVVCAAYALNNIIVIPIIQNFGLIFKDLFFQLGLTGTDIAIIMNVNNAFGLALGLFNGPLLRRFGYRKCAIVASLLVSAGVGLTSFARSFPEFLIFYGIIMSAGCALTMTSFSYAINSYFKKRRSLAMGFAMTATGLGPIALPLLISLSMKEFGARGTSLLLSGLSLHSVAAALLLQPIKWHLRKPDPIADEADTNKDKKDEKLPVTEELQQPQQPEEEPEGSQEPEDETGDVAKPMLSARRPSVSSRKSGARTPTPRRQGQGRFEGGEYWASVGSVHSMHSMDLGGSMLALDTEPTTGKEKSQHNSQANGKVTAEQKQEKKEEADGESNENTAADRSLLMRILKGIVSFFDLSLLRDPIYVNLMLGMSLAVFAEVNFSLMTPFILGERNFDTQGIASLISMIAVADIVFRFLAPFIKKLCRQSIRVMYMMGLALLIITRTFLIFAYDYKMVVTVMFALGVSKGIRTVFWTLVIPDYVPIDRLPAASGIQSVTNGLVFLALGPLVGVIRDRIGSYNAVIMVVNSLTILAISMWCIEFVIVALRRKRRNKNERDVEGKT